MGRPGVRIINSYINLLIREFLDAKVVKSQMYRYNHGLSLILSVLHGSSMSNAPSRSTFPFWAVRFFRKVTAQIYVSILGGAFYEDEHRPDLTFLYERCILPFYSPPKSISVIWAVRLPNFSTVQNRILRSERCILHFYPPPRFVFSFWAVLTAFFTSSPAPSTCRSRHALTARNCGATNHTAQQSPAKSPLVASHCRRSWNHGLRPAASRPAKQPTLAKPPPRGAKQRKLRGAAALGRPTPA